MVPWKVKQTSVCKAKFILWHTFYRSFWVECWLKRFAHLFTRIKSFRVMFYPRSVIQLLERLSIFFYGKRQTWDSTELRNFQNKKWIDKNSLRHFLWIELEWIYRFSFSCNEPKTTSNGETWSRGTNSRLQFAANSVINLSIIPVPFALFQVLDVSDEFILTVITYIGCSVSIFSAFLTVITFLSLP